MCINEITYKHGLQNLMLFHQVKELIFKLHTANKSIVNFTLPCDIKDYISTFLIHDNSDTVVSAI